MLAGSRFPQQYSFWSSPFKETGIDVPPKPPPAYSASAEAQGRFEFPNIKPGDYFLTVKAAGYLPQSYRGRFGYPGTKISLIDRQKMTDVAFRLVQEAIITGRILNQDGDPIPGLRVFAERRTYPQNRALFQARVMTSADGVFSMSLSSGVYYVSAMSMDGNGGEAYIATYYPSAADPAVAAAIPVSGGATVHLADMHLRKSRVYRIRGRLIDAATGAAPQGRVQVSIHPQSPPFSRLASGSGRMGPQGAFDYAFFAPGVYIVDAQPMLAPSGVEPPVGLTGRQTVTVTNADVDMVLRLTPALEITGTVAPGGPGRISLTTLDGISFPGMAELQPDGGFAVHSLVPAVYRVRPMGLPEGTYIKSIHYGDLDITEGPLDLTSGVKGRLNIQLAPNAASITGSVRDANGVALPDVTVTLWKPGIPASAAADFSQMAISGADGKFEFTNLPPGEYRVAAWEEIDSSLAILPKFRTKFDSRATTVKLNENDHGQIESGCCLVARSKPRPLS